MTDISAGKSYRLWQRNQTADIPYSTKRRHNLKKLRNLIATEEEKESKKPNNQFDKCTTISIQEKTLIKMNESDFQKVFSTSKYTNITPPIVRGGPLAIWNGN
ncbi:hypothetical protein BpHYR1_010422 [Brachionus plicatilis]|uniref:Uncharacterized protein n=1 Tax=Brachionus plicatilis TaxID=10195 RepID=A0A3M7PHX1_BRAPC|nr:hypothetical protein BpHYR1_010422 [Brachionus plicatilis]